MSNAVLVALIGFAGAVVGSIIGAISSAKLVTYRLEQLEKKVNLHNQVIERTYKLEKDEAVFHERLNVIEEEVKEIKEIKENHSK